MGRIFDVHTDFVSNGSFQSLKNNVRFYNDENYAYMIRLQDASNNWRGPWLYTDKHGFDFLKKSTVYENDILMSDRGTIGKFFLVPKLDRPMTLSSNAVLLRSSNCNNNFIYYMLNTIDIGNQIKKRTTPGVQPMISKTEFKKIITKLPVREEQKKIGDFLKKIDETFTLHQRKFDQLKKLKKAYLQAMFVSMNTKNNKVPKLRFTDFEGDWELCKLGEVFDFKQGVQVPVEEQFTTLEEGMQRFIRIVDLTTDEEPPRYIKYDSDNLVSESDLFMVRYGAVGVIGLGYEGVIANNLFKLIPRIVVDEKFSYHQLIKNKDKIISLSSSTTMPALSFKTLKNLSFSVPSVGEQKQIGSFFANLDNLITLHQNKLEQLNELKKSYLQNMFI
ncbi:restriction endonuclease subunit S [Enterococcus faecalis]|uniref:restriction endonuclease subunit S n=1 Tax=Enterococcus faecalis TaxID=1351 RepID=UPI00115E2A1F|nr:restriction endonuclease subunit S [Enterococcus faecalis]